MGVYCTHRVLCYLSAFGLPELDLLKSSGQSLFSKTFWIPIHANELYILVPSLSLNNLIPLTTFFSVVFLSLDKTMPLRIGKIGTLPDWQNWDPSGLAKWLLGDFLNIHPIPFRISSPMLLRCLNLLGRVFRLSQDPSALKLSLLFNNSP